MISLMNILEENMASQEKIFDKTINNLTLKETISMIIFAAKMLANNSNFAENEIWKDYYQEFEKNMEDQIKKKWPRLTITRNNYNKRIDISSTDTSYIVSDNLLTLLVRVLFIENYKRKYIYKSYNYHNVLGHKLSNSLNKSTTQISLEELFNLLRDQMTYYLQIYNDVNHFENCLAKKIFLVLENISQTDDNYR